MAGNVCDNCGTVVTDDEFCPNCGNWIDPMTDSSDSGTDVEEFRLGAPPAFEDEAPARIPRAEVQCPSCGSSNPANNRHCEECGARLGQGQLPVAPRPAVQATAGVRAAMALAALLFGIVIIALLFNSFGGDDSTTTIGATDNSTTTTTAPARPVSIISATCSVEGYSGFDCDNLIDAGDGEYQFNWDSLAGTDQEVTITLTFDQPYRVQSVVWENLADSDRYFQNYRAKAITVSDKQPTGFPAPIELKDQPGPSTYTYIAVSTSQLEIIVTNVYAAEERGGQVFSDFAVQQIEVIGSPVIAESTPTTGATTTTEG